MEVLLVEVYYFIFDREVGHVQNANPESLPPVLVYIIKIVGDKLIGVLLFCNFCRYCQVSTSLVEPSDNWATSFKPIMK